MSNPGQTNRRGQRGMALVMVMGVLAVTLLMVVHVMTVCELAGRDAYVNASRSELRYVAESALAHSFWIRQNMPWMMNLTLPQKKFSVWIMSFARVLAGPAGRMP